MLRHSDTEICGSCLVQNPADATATQHYMLGDLTQTFSKKLEAGDAFKEILGGCERPCKGSGVFLDEAGTEHGDSFLVSELLNSPSQRPLNHRAKNQRANHKQNPHTRI